MVRKALEESEDKDMETAAHFMSKSVALIQVLDQSFKSDKEDDPTILAFQQDKSQFMELREQMSSTLQDNMIEAIKKEDEAGIQKIAHLFKAVGEEEKGMKHYTQFIMHMKT